MGEEVLERYVRQTLAASSNPSTHFEWHGGEPTLLGLDFFRRVVVLQKKYLASGRTVTNGLQTNGLLLDARWADFLAREGFSVGLSLDGPRDLHDRWRRTADGAPTHSRVVKAFHLLKERGVFCNILCVVHRDNAREPDRVYDFFGDLRARYIQFLPLVGQGHGKGVSPFAAPPETIGSFLCRIFDRWAEEDVGRVVIQNIDEALRPVFGAEHALCVHRPTCGNVAVLDRDGGFYACDHFVCPQFQLGDIRDRTLAELACDPRLIAFGEAKQQTLPASCKRCPVLDACNGGCPKDRLVDLQDDPYRLNHLCPAYKAFFTHSRPLLTRLAAHMRTGKPLMSFR